MIESKNKKVAIIATVVMLIGLVIYNSIVIAEFYVSNYGEVVDAKVTDVSEICRYKRKYVTLLIDSENKRVKVYGRSCRKDEFLLGSIIKIRRSKRFDIITLPKNLSTTRLIAFPLFTVLVLSGLILLIKKPKNDSIK